MSFYTALMLLQLRPRTQIVARYLVGGWNTESIAIQIGTKRITIKCYHLTAIRKATGQPSIAKAVLAILHDPTAMHYLFDVRPTIYPSEN